MQDTSSSIIPAYYPGTIGRDYLTRSILKCLLEAFLHRSLQKEEK